MSSKIKRRTFVYVVISIFSDSNIHSSSFRVQNVFCHLKDAQTYVDNMNRYGLGLMEIERVVLL